MFIEGFYYNAQGVYILLITDTTHRYLHAFAVVAGADSTEHTLLT